MNQISGAVPDESARIAAQWFAELKPKPWVKVIEADTVPKTFINKTRMRLPLAVKLSVTGSNNSAARGDVTRLTPPAISTLPFLSNVAVCNSRGIVKLPVGDTDSVRAAGWVGPLSPPQAMMEAARAGSVQQA